MDEPLRLIQLVERLGLLLRTDIRRAAARDGLSEVHLAILDYLSRCNRFSNTAAGVSAYLGITKGTISQSIQRLEERGLLRKVPDEDDRRVVRLHLTRRGQRRVRGLAVPRWHRVVAGMPERTVSAAVEALTRLLGDLQREHGYRTFQSCRTCRHLRGRPGRHHCGLTGEALYEDDLERICVDHDARAVTAPGSDRAR